MKKHGFEEMNLKAVLFDMDGVLFDSMPNHALAWSEGMKKYGLPMTKEEALQECGRCLRCDVFGIGALTGRGLEQW